MASASWGSNFFVLSGFLIGRMLFDVAERRLDVRQFLLRRWFRTLPNYYLFLAINAVLFHRYLGQPAGNASYMLFAQMLIRRMDSAFFAESWSLCGRRVVLFAGGACCRWNRLHDEPWPESFTAYFYCRGLHLAYIAASGDRREF